MGRRVGGRAVSRYQHFVVLTTSIECGIFPSLSILNNFAHYQQKLSELHPEKGPAKTFVHSVSHYGHMVSIKVLHWHNAVFVYFSTEMIQNVSKEW